MKNLVTIIALLLFTFSINAQMVEVKPDSIYADFDYVEKGKHTVYFNEVALSPQHTKQSKARLRAASLKTIYPEANIYTKAPIGEPKTIFKVFLDQSKLIRHFQKEADGDFTFTRSLIENNDQIQIKGNLKKVDINTGEEILSFPVSTDHGAWHGFLYGT